MKATTRVRRMIDPHLFPRRASAAVAGVMGGLVAAGGVVAGEPVAGLLVGLGLAGGMSWLSVHLIRDGVEAREEARELWGLTGVMVEGTPWPAPGGWALGAGAISRLMVEMEVRDCRTVVELGPGASSVVLGRARPDLHIVGLEHDPTYVDLVSVNLRAHGLAGYQLVHAPLAPLTVDGRRTLWYDVAALDRLPEKVDVLIVDGPPNPDGDGTRAPAWPVLRTRMAPGGLVLVDDTDRPDERRMVEAWTLDGSLRELAKHRAFTLLEVC